MRPFWPEPASNWRPTPHEIDTFWPFDPVGKRTEAVVVPRDGENYRVAKGAPQVVPGSGGRSARSPGG